MDVNAELAAVGTQVLSDLSNAPAPSPEPTPTPTPSPAPAAVAADPTPATPATAPAATPGDDTVVDVNGLKMTLKQVREGYMRQADYTRKTQELAARAKEAEQWQQELQQLKQREQTLRQSLSDPNEVLGYAVSQFGPEQVQAWLQGQIHSNAAAQGQALDPRMVAQMAQAQVAKAINPVTSEIGKVREETQASIRQAVEQLKLEREQAEHERALASTFGEIFSQHPELRAVGEMEDILRYRAFAKQPETIEQAKQFLVEEAQRQAAAIRGLLVAEKKADAVEKAKLQAVEPPGGVGPSHQPTTDFRKPDGSVDWQAMSASAVAMLSR